jgi:hypothetical protein
VAVPQLLLPDDLKSKFDLGCNADEYGRGNYCRCKATATQACDSSVAPTKQTKLENHFQRHNQELSSPATAAPGTSWQL